MTPLPSPGMRWARESRAGRALMVGCFKSTQPWPLLKMTQRYTPKILAQPRSTKTQLGSLKPCHLGWGTLRREALSFLSGSDVDRQILYGSDEDRETSTDGRQTHSKSAGVGAHLKDHPRGEDTGFRPRSKAPQVRTPTSRGASSLSCRAHFSTH